MAQYKFERHLKFSTDGQYEKVLPAGSPAPRSGIYRCDGCGWEITILAGQPLPDGAHHEHVASQKLVRWKLIVADSGPPAPSHLNGAVLPSAAANPISRPARF